MYGNARRAVLWTLTNVADDCLENHQIDEAEALYLDALRISTESLEGFDQAKTNYAAYEGLAKTTLLRGDLNAMKGSSRLVECQKAIGYLEHTSNVAVSWFGPCNRRVIRVRCQIEELQQVCENTTEVISKC